MLVTELGDPQRGNRNSMSFRHAISLLGDDAGSEKDELLASVATAKVTRPHASLQTVGNLFQDHVAGGVAEAIVDGLEVIDVDEQDCNGLAGNDLL